MNAKDFTDEQKVAWLWCNWYHRDENGVWSKENPGVPKTVYPSLEVAFHLAYHHPLNSQLAS